MHPDLDLNFITTAVSLTASDQKIDFKIIGTLVSILLRSTALHTKNQCFDLKAHLKHTFDIQSGNQKLMSFASFHWKEIHIFHNSFSSQSMKLLSPPLHASCIWVFLWISTWKSSLDVVFIVCFRSEFHNVNFFQTEFFCPLPVFSGSEPGRW